MSGLKEMVLLCEIGFQSKIALRAGERLKATQNKTDHIEIWSSIQTILIATGIVSRILWPGKRFENRGKELRQILNVNDDHILKDRTFRNHFEHYEDRIVEWFESHSSAAYIDLAMNPSLSFGSTRNCHRGYNSFNNTLVFRGELLDLSQLLEALENISNNPYTFSK